MVFYEVMFVGIKFWVEMLFIMFVCLCLFLMDE